jgi:hypothetical protein
MTLKRIAGGSPLTYALTKHMDDPTANDDKLARNRKRLEGSWNGQFEGNKNKQLHFHFLPHGAFNMIVKDLPTQEADVKAGFWKPISAAGDDITIEVDVDGSVVQWTIRLDRNDMFYFSTPEGTKIKGYR